MDEKVEVDEINFDVERVQSERCWNYLLNLHKQFGYIRTNIKVILTHIVSGVEELLCS